MRGRERGEIEGEEGGDRGEIVRERERREKRERKWKGKRMKEGEEGREGERRREEGYWEERRKRG